MQALSQLSYTPPEKSDIIAGLCASHKA
jgi:hypothetical protein